ncbi:hypothetical protein ZWY2020_051098 [Hordeum vulgare]|nr:hypothetical protein ZWY2020_051098 [Hordeum vulgare]
MHTPTKPRWAPCPRIIPTITLISRKGRGEAAACQSTHTLDRTEQEEPETEESRAFQGWEGFPEHEVGSPGAQASTSSHLPAPHLFHHRTQTQKRGNPHQRQPWRQQVPPTMRQLSPPSLAASRANGAEKLPPNADRPLWRSRPPPAPAASPRPARFAKQLDRLHADDPILPWSASSSEVRFCFLVVGAAIWASSVEIFLLDVDRRAPVTRMRIQYLRRRALKRTSASSAFDVLPPTSSMPSTPTQSSFQRRHQRSSATSHPLMATFVAGCVVGFTAAWQLALVTLSPSCRSSPSSAASPPPPPLKALLKSQDALSSASNIAEQALSQIRIVQSFVGGRVAQACSSA